MGDRTRVNLEPRCIPPVRGDSPAARAYVMQPPGRAVPKYVCVCVKCGCAAAPLRRPAGPPGRGPGCGSASVGPSRSRAVGRCVSRLHPVRAACRIARSTINVTLFLPTRRLCTYLPLYYHRDPVSVLGSVANPRDSFSFTKCRRRRGREPSLARPVRRSAGAASCLGSSALKAKPIGPSQKARRGTQKYRAHPFRSSSDRHEDTRPSPAQLGVL